MLAAHGVLTMSAVTREAVDQHRLATHEAMHAVTAILLGCRVKSVTIYHGGCCEHVADPDPNVNALVVLAGGGIDGEISDGDEENWERMCRQDPTLRQRRQHLIGELRRLAGY